MFGAKKGARFKEGPIQIHPAQSGTVIRMESGSPALATVQQQLGAIATIFDLVEPLVALRRVGNEGRLHRGHKTRRRDRLRSMSPRLLQIESGSAVTERSPVFGRHKDVRTRRDLGGKRNEAVAAQPPAL